MFVKAIHVRAHRGRYLSRRLRLQPVNTHKGPLTRCTPTTIIPTRDRATERERRHVSWIDRHREEALEKRRKTESERKSERKGGAERMDR